MKSDNVRVGMQQAPHRSLFNALGSLLKYTADPQDKLPEITYWLMGSFTSASYQKILIGCPLIVAGIIIIYLLRWRLNILSLSDDEARTSGINITATGNAIVVQLPVETFDTHNYLAASDIVITKAGWGTISEALLSKRNLVLIDREGVLEDTENIEESIPE